MSTVITRPLSATAPEAAEHTEHTEPQTDRDRTLHDLCESWVSWQRSRRLFGPKPLKGSILGKLSSTRAMPRNTGGPDAPCSAQLSAFHIAYTCQPDAMDKRVFDAYYVHRIKPIKSAAAALGIGRAHFYTLLRDFSRRVASAAQAIAADNAEAAQALHQRLAKNAQDAQYQ